MSIKKYIYQLRHKIFWSFAAKGVAFIFLFLINLYLARMLGVNDFGKWSFIWSIFTIALLISSFGVNASAKNFIAREKNDAVFSSALMVRLLVSIFFVIVFGFVLVIFSDFFPENFLILFLLLLPLILFSTILDFFKEIFSGLQLTFLNFVANFCEYGLKFFGIILFFMFSQEILGVIATFIVSVFIAAIISFLLIRQYFKKIVSMRRVRDIFQYSLPLFFTSVGFGIATELDTVMIGILQGSTEVGIYSVAKKFVLFAPQFATAFAMGILPIFARMNAKNIKSLRHFFYAILRNASIFYGVIVVFLLFFGKFLIVYLYGTEYSNSFLVLLFLLPYLFVSSLSVFLSGFLDFRGLAKKRAFYLSFSIIVNIVLNFLLIPQYGSVGAAISTSLSFLPYLALNLHEIKKEFQRSQDPK